MSSRHRERSRSRDRDRHRDKERDREKRDKDRDRHRSSHSSSGISSSSSKRFLESLMAGIEGETEKFKESKRDRSRSRERRSKKRRSRSRGRKSKDRDGTIALLDQMVGTTTTTTARQLNGGANMSTAAAILAAAAVAQVSYRRIQAPVQPAAAAAAALSAATAIPTPTSVQQRLEQLQARSEGRYGHRERDREREREKEKEKEREKDREREREAIAAAQRDEQQAPPEEHDHDDGLGPPGETAAERRARRRRTRWAGSEHDKTFIPGLPTVLPSSLTKEQEEQYLLQLQIEEVSRKLRSGDLGIPTNIEERSPSPEPIYSTDGKRLNTREYRTRRKLEEQRHKLVQRMHEINPEFKPPADYKPPIIRVHDKVMIPQEEHPDINFVGLLIGPRGNTLKSMEKDTGAKIIIRGKGSVKEGKVGRKDGQPLPGEDEPLHAYITATNAECVKKAVEKIKEVIRQGVEVPEGQNDLRRMQLRELAQLNGTLRENDAHRCANCAATDHKTWLCPDKPNVTNSIVCSSCGGAGHIARDCRQKRPGHGGPPGGERGQGGGGGHKTKIDEEYMSLMAELGEAPPPGQQDSKPAPRRTYYGSPFDRPRHQPRAIMQSQGIPSSLPPPPSNFAPPPPPPQHQQQQRQQHHNNPPWLNNNQPPPPGAGVNMAVPPLMPQYPHQQNDNKMGGNMGGPQQMQPPPGMMGPPPGMGGGGAGGWRGPYGGGMAVPPWGAPPPPPPPHMQPPAQHRGFLAPPPPPPPS